MTEADSDGGNAAQCVEMYGSGTVRATEVCGGGSGFAASDMYLWGV